MPEGDPDQPMRARAGENRLKLWLLMDADRRVVAAIVPVFVAVCVLLTEVVVPVELTTLVGESDPVETLFQGFLTAIVTGVTLVVSINSLVLSQELGPLGDQRDRMEGAMAFREDTESLLGVPVSPPEPSAFMRALLDEVRDRAESVLDDLEDAGAGDTGSQANDEAVEAQTGSEGSDDPADRVAAYLNDLVEHADSVGDSVAEEQFGTFGVLFAALDFDYSRTLYEARRLRDSHDGSLPDDAVAGLDDLVTVLELYGPAREHFKTLYFQWELIDLSRWMLYVAVPALAVSAVAILFLTSADAVGGSTLGVANLTWVVAAATATAVTPFAVLLSVVLRVATVAKRTLSIGPFLLRRADRATDLDWGD